MYESGLPVWAIFLPTYGLYYRPWMRRVTWILFIAVSVFSMACGFYDLYKNVPHVDQVRYSRQSSHDNFSSWQEQLPYACNRKPARCMLLLSAQYMMFSRQRSVIPSHVHRHNAEDSELPLVVYHCPSCMCSTMLGAISQICARVMLAFGPDAWW